MSNEGKVCPKMSGYLEKKNKIKVMGSWKNYWFVLEGKLLLYYRSKDEFDTLSPCKGSINLGPRCSVKPVAGGTCIFQIETRSKTIVLKAKNRLEQEKWLQAILAALNQSPSCPNGMNHFRYSSDDLIPIAVSEMKKSSLFTRQNTMPVRLTINKIKSKKIEQDISNPYCGSLETIQQAVKASMITYKNSKRKQHCSSHDVTFTSGDDAVRLRSNKRNTFSEQNVGSQTSLIIDNDQYCTKINDAETELVSKETDPDFLRGKPSMTEHIYERIRSEPVSQILDNDFYILESNIYAQIPDDANSSQADKPDEAQENLQSRCTLKDAGICCVGRESDSSEIGNYIRKSDKCEPIPSGNSASILVDNNFYITRNSCEPEIVIENDQYGTSKIKINETDTVNYHEYNLPNKESDNIYSLPHIYEQTDVNENSVQSYVDDQVNPYSVCQLYPKANLVTENRNTGIYQELVEYSEPLLPPRPDNNDVSVKKTNTASENDYKAIKRSSFIKNIFRKMIKKSPQTATVNEDTLKLADTSSESDKQLLNELKKLLVDKKSILEEHMNLETSSNEEKDENNTHTVDIQENKAGKYLKPVLPYKQRKLHPNLKMTKLSHSSEKLKTVEEILMDLDKEKNEQDRKLSKVKHLIGLFDTLSSNEGSDSSKEKAKNLIDKFNNDLNCGSVVLRQKSPRSRKKNCDDIVLGKSEKNGDNHCRHSDELNTLLNELAKVINAPILTPGVTTSLGVTITDDNELATLVGTRSRRYSDPDYDIPRPHTNLKITRSAEKEDGSLTATRFFGPVLSGHLDSMGLPTQTTSITPDSLEIGNKFNDDNSMPSYTSHSYITKNLKNKSTIYQQPKSFFLHSKPEDSIASDVFIDSLEPNAEISTVL